MMPIIGLVMTRWMFSNQAGLFLFNRYCCPHTYYHGNSKSPVTSSRVTNKEPPASMFQPCGRCRSALSASLPCPGHPPCPKFQTNGPTSLPGELLVTRNRNTFSVHAWKIVPAQSHTHGFYLGSTVLRCSYILLTVSSVAGSVYCWILYDVYVASQGSCIWLHFTKVRLFCGLHISDV